MVNVSFSQALFWRNHWETNSIPFFLRNYRQADLHWIHTTELPRRSGCAGRLSSIPRAALWNGGPGSHRSHFLA